MRHNCSILVFLFSCLVFSGAESVPSFNSRELVFPESHDLRREYFSSLDREDPAPFFPVEEQVNREFRIKIDRSYNPGDGTETVQFRCESLVPLATGQSVRSGIFPRFSRGSYEFLLDSETHEILEITIYLKDAEYQNTLDDGDTRTFLHLDRRGDRASGDLVLFGVPLLQNLTIPLSLEKVSQLSFREFRLVTRFKIPWEWVFPETTAPFSTLSGDFSRYIRAAMTNLEDRDDGAQDSDGSWVHIKDLSPQDGPGVNCSGFAKWVADQGRPVSSISDLKRPRLTERGHAWSEDWEEDREPYFGLDWTRNLALVSGDNDPLGPSDSVDVSSLPYSAYTPNVGYPVSDLDRVMVQLATLEPGYFYLGSLNQSYGEAPVLRQHTHVMVFFPGYDPQGRYSLVVMERGREVSLKTVKERDKGAFVHLVRVKIPTLEWEPRWSSQPTTRR